MAGPNDDDAAAAFAREGDEFLDLVEGVWLDVELGAGVELECVQCLIWWWEMVVGNYGEGPGVVVVLWYCAEGDGGVGVCQRGLETWIVHV